jgi:hypothetical protein
MHHVHHGWCAGSTPTEIPPRWGHANTRRERASGLSPRSSRASGAGENWRAGAENVPQGGAANSFHHPSRCRVTQRKRRTDGRPPTRIGRFFMLMAQIYRCRAFNAMLLFARKASNNLLEFSSKFKELISNSEFSFKCSPSSKLTNF